MIDIHSHLVPGVDDGSQSLDESLSLLEQAEKEGITEIVTTPHFMKNGEFRIRANELVKRFNELKQGYQGTIRLHLGNELYIHTQLPELLEQGEVLTLAESKYILVEFPFKQYKDEYDEILYELSLGNQIIIAHPERYSYVQKDPNYCVKWLNEGYLLQSNQNSLFVKETKKVLMPMIENGFISFIASDAHNKRRPLTLNSAHAFLVENFGIKLAELLLEENPRQLLTDKIISVPEYRVIRKVKKHFFWF